MNSLLLQMIAARANGTGNPALADMLARIGAGRGGNPIPNPSELLAQLSNGNSLLSALRKQFAEVQTSGSSHQPTPLAMDAVIDVQPEAESCESVAKNGQGKPIDTVEPAPELQERVQNLRVEIKTLRERCDLLASAVGACCLCWGHDPGCRACRGRGKPGFAIPDEALFGEFVLPAIRVLRAQRAKPSGPPVPPQPQGGMEPGTQVSRT